jgi:hypothetical protein
MDINSLIKVSAALCSNVKKQWDSGEKFKNEFFARKTNPTQYTNIKTKVF